MNELNEQSNNILRYGNIVCVFAGGNSKYIIVNYKKDCFEIEQTLGETQRVKKYKNSRPKYYDIQINCKHNLIKQ